MPPRAWARLQRLTWAEWRTVLGLFVWACVIEVAVRVVSLPRLARALSVRLEDRDDPASEAVAGVQRAETNARAAIVDRFYAHWPIRGSCLRRSLVLGHHLRDLEPVLRIGVVRENGEVKAHAWVEVQGEPVGREGGDFTPLRGPVSSS